MATLEQRLLALESNNMINKDNVTAVILVSFAGKDDPECPINHVRFENDHFYMADGEAEADFTSRASAEIRMIKQPNPNSVLLLFGDRATKDN